MRRRSRRRPAPPRALTPKSTIWKAPGSLDSGALRVSPLGFRTESGIRPRSYRGWVGRTLYPSSAPTGEPTLSGTPLSPCFAAESTREGTLMSLPEGIATPRSSLVRAGGGAVSSVVTSGCPKRSEGGFPVGTRTYAAPHRPVQAFTSRGVLVLVRNLHSHAVKADGVAGV